MYAVIKTGGKQYRVKEGDVVSIEKLDGEIGSKVEFKDVLMLRPDEDAKIKIGNPVIKKASVVGKIVQQGKGPKIQIYTFKRRKRFERRKGHRQLLTDVKIDAIKTGSRVAKKKEKVEDGA